MAINFPNNPVAGQTFTSNGVGYEFDGQVWNLTGSNPFMISAAFDQANAAYGQANSANITADSAYAQANIARTHSNGAFDQANVTAAIANAAFSRANNAVLKTGNTMTGNLVMSGANITFVDATNSGIYWSNTGFSFIHSPAANTLVFGTSSTEDMRIDANGNVGIATSNPSSFGKFAVQGASTTRAFYADALAQPVARYDDNSFVSNGLTIRNTGVTGSNQGIGLLFQLGAGGTAVDSGAIQMRSEADYSTAANQDAAMLFFTAANGTASERMRIDSSGNVGIGTSSPVDLLQVNRGSGSGITSGISLSTAAGGVGDGSYIKWTGAGTGEKIARIDGVQEGTDVGSIRFNTGNGADGFAERMRIDSSGNVGIGTSSPSNGRLHVVGAGGLQGVKIENTSTGLSAAAGLILKGPAGTARSTILAHSNSDAGGNLTQFYIAQQNSSDAYVQTITLYDYPTNTWLFYTNNSERMRIDSSGRVGIGTSSPGYALEVAGALALGGSIYTGKGISTGDVSIELGEFRTGSGPTYIDLHSVSGTDYEARFIRNAGTNGSCALYNTGTGAFEITQIGAGVLYFATNSLERMRITSGGDVGIGTSSPNSKLHVNGPVTLTANYMTYLVNAYYDGSWKYVENGIAWGIGNNFGGPTNGVCIAAAASNSGGAGAALTWLPRLNIDSSGNVGIGTSSPACLLDVTGGIQTSRTTVTSPATTDGNIFSGSYTPTLTNTTNITSSTASTLYYTRVGNVVAVFGRVNITATATGNTLLGISLPIASALTTNGQVAGMGSLTSSTVTNNTFGRINADTTNDRAQFQLDSTLTTDQTYAINFTYVVL